MKPRTVVQHMVEARVITFRQVQQVTETGDLESALQPVIVGPPVTGQLELDAIPREEFSRDLVAERVRAEVAELVPEGEGVDVSFDTVDG